jgi:hypothetical protein
MRILGGLLTLVLFILPLLTAPLQPVAAIGLIAVVLAGVGIAALWLWPVTTASCVFLVQYAVALTISAGPVSIAGAAGFSLALLLLLHVVDLARRVRQVRVDAAVILAHVRRWVGVYAGAVVGAALALVMAGVFAMVLPVSASPLLAGAGALGTLVALAAVVKHAARGERR